MFIRKITNSWAKKETLRYTNLFGQENRTMSHPSRFYEPWYANLEPEARSAIVSFQEKKAATIIHPTDVYIGVAAKKIIWINIG